jgi:hypothetical protein
MTSRRQALGELFERAAQRLTVAGCALVAWLVISAHVGTSQVVFEGTAGGYPLRVMISPPGVVPAQVPIAVRVLRGMPTRVSVRAAQWNVGTKGAPPAEAAAIVPGDPGVWSHDLWIMTASTYAVYVAVEGPAGNGTLVVPLQTSATRTLGMTTGMTYILIVLGTLLVGGLLTIVGAALREGTLPAGEQASVSRRRTARLATAGTASLLTLALLGGSKWWAAEERDYKRRMLKPIALSAAIKSVDSDRVLTIAITDSAWLDNRMAPLMPDHGKLMHLFLIRADNQDVLAHLHPLRVHADTFVTPLPPMREGRYLLFGDLLFQNGAQRTLVDTVDVPVAPVVSDEPATHAVLRSATGIANVRAPADADDAWRAVTPVPLGSAAMLPSGGSITLRTDDTSATLRTGRDLRLVVAVVDGTGRASTLEPYMGMGGHAMVLRRDAGIFMHLHPMGTASMTAQAQLIRRERGDTAMLDSAAIAAATRNAEMHDMPAMEQGATNNAGGAAMQMTAASPAASVAPLSTQLAFPFAFPTSGVYRVFVQVKRNGVVETAAFDVTVAAAAKILR